MDVYFGLEIIARAVLSGYSLLKKRTEEMKKCVNAPMVNTGCTSKRTTGGGSI